MATFRQRGRENNAKVFISDFETKTNNTYFISIGNAVTSPVASVTRAADTMQADQNAWNNMFFMNQIFRSDLSLMIKKIDWISGTRYEAFDKNKNQYELNEKFYAYNSENNSVYLCLASPENENSVSTYPPTTQGLNPEVKPDGYTWKFLYQVREENLEKFDYPGFLPIENVGVELYTDERVLQQNVEVNTVKGAIESIDVVQQGASFPEIVNNNFVSNLYYGYATEDTVEGDDIHTEYYFDADLEGRTELSRVANFYDNNYIIHFKNGYTALIEETETVTNPTSGNPAIRFKICNLLYDLVSGDTQFIIPPLNEPFCIIPYIRIIGNGSDAVAIPVFDLDKKITRVDLIYNGKNYTYAEAKFLVNSTTILSPVLGLNGLTSNVVKLLGAKHVMISKKIKPITTLSQSDPILYSSVENTGVVYSGDQYLDVVSENTYYTQFCLIKNPKILNIDTNLQEIAGSTISEIREMVIESIDPKVTIVVGTPLNPYTNSTNFFEVDDIIVRGPDSRPDQFQAKITNISVSGISTTVECDLINGAFETYSGYRIKNNKNTSTDFSDDEFFEFLDCEENCSNSIYATYTNVFNPTDFSSDDALFGTSSYKSAEIYPPLSGYVFVNPVYPNRAKVKVKDAELGFLPARYVDGEFVPGETIIGLKDVLGVPTITAKGSLVSISEPTEILSETSFGYAYILRCTVNRSGADTVYDLVNEDGVSLETNTIIQQPSTGAIGKIIRVGLPTGTDGSSTVYLYVNNYNDKEFTALGGSSDILQTINDLYDPTTAQNMNLYVQEVIFKPSLVPYSGDLLYINDAGPVQRRVENSEIIKLLIEF